MKKNFEKEPEYDKVDRKALKRSKQAKQKQLKNFIILKDEIGQE